MSSRVASGKMAQPEGMQPAVLYKLVLFAILMAVVPIGTYFGTLSHLFNGNTTYSAISAVLAANVVLVGYVVVAFREEVASSTAQGQTIGLEKRKDR
ncbi:VMA21-like domain-containing protein, partial [Papiliotrema laurentii]